MSEKKSGEPTAGPQSVATTLEEATASEYKYGFVSDIDNTAGTERGCDTLYFPQEGGAGMAAAVPS